MCLRRAPEKYITGAALDRAGLLCQPRVIMITEKSVELLSVETEVLGENLPQCCFVHHKPHMLTVREPGPPRWEASV
jgi:hypothetical protein